MTAGRPTVMTDDTVNKLEEAFLMGCTDGEACLSANISRETLYKYIRNNPEFSDRKDILKKNPIFLARQAVISSLKEKDINTSKWVLDKHDGKAKERLELSGGVDVNNKIEYVDPRDTVTEETPADED